MLWGRVVSIWGRYWSVQTCNRFSFFVWCCLAIEAGKATYSCVSVRRALLAYLQDLKSGQGEASTDQFLKRFEISGSWVDIAEVVYLKQGMQKCFFVCRAVYKWPLNTALCWKSNICFDLLFSCRAFGRDAVCLRSSRSFQCLMKYLRHSTFFANKSHFLTMIPKRLRHVSISLPRSIWSSSLLS